MIASRVKAELFFVFLVINLIPPKDNAAAFRTSFVRFLDSVNSFAFRNIIPLFFKTEYLLRLFLRGTLFLRFQRFSF